MALLANLYPHIRGSQEDIATYSLQYILSESASLNRSFTIFLSETLHCEVIGNVNYICQASGENKERPDMAGIDEKGKEQFLCEAKFYAGLTDNQPNAYLDRLVLEKGSGLVFICPAIRKQLLWGQLRELVEKRELYEIGEFCLSVDGVNMAIVAWSEVISVLRRTASAYAIKMLADIDQIEGFCQKMDSDSFIPFSAKEMGPETARREERYYRVVDELIAYLKTDKGLKPSTKGVKASAYRKGYTKSVKIQDYWVTINYERDLWLNPNISETPFWVAIRSGEDWKQGGYFDRAFRKIPIAEQGNLLGTRFLALYPKLYGTLDEVVHDMKKQIMHYIDIVEEERMKSSYN